MTNPYDSYIEMNELLDVINQFAYLFVGSLMVMLTWIFMIGVPFAIYIVALKISKENALRMEENSSVYIHFKSAVITIFVSMFLSASFATIFVTILEIEDDFGKALATLLMITK